MLGTHPPYRHENDKLPPNYACSTVLFDFYLEKMRVARVKPAHLELDTVLHGVQL